MSSALTGWVHSCCLCTTRTWVGWGSDTIAPSRSPGLTADTLRSQTCHIWCCQRTGRWCGFCLLEFSAGWVQPFGCKIKEWFHCACPCLMRWWDKASLRWLNFSIKWQSDFKAAHYINKVISSASTPLIFSSLKFFKLYILLDNPWRKILKKCFFWNCFLCQWVCVIIGKIKLFNG